MEGSEGSDDEWVSSRRSDTDDDSPVVETSGNSGVFSSGEEGSIGGKGFVAAEDVACECRVLPEGGMAGLVRTVDWRP